MLLLFLRYYLIQVQVVQRLALATSEAKKLPAWRPKKIAGFDDDYRPTLLKS